MVCIPLPVRLLQDLSNESCYFSLLIFKPFLRLTLRKKGVQKYKYFFENEIVKMKFLSSILGGGKNQYKHRPLALRCLLPKKI
jgi:hypothetical protein